MLGDRWGHQAGPLGRGWWASGRGCPRGPCYSWHRKGKEEEDVCALLPREGQQDGQELWGLTDLGSNSSLCHQLAVSLEQVI